MRVVAQDYAGLGVTEIARTVCELLEWKRPSGAVKKFGYVQGPKVVESKEARVELALRLFSAPSLLWSQLATEHRSGSLSSFFSNLL